MKRCNPGLQLLHKLTENHIALKPSLRMRVNLAVQVGVMLKNWNDNWIKSWNTQILSDPYILVKGQSRRFYPHIVLVPEGRVNHTKVLHEIFLLGLFSLSRLIKKMLTLAIKLQMTIVLCHLNAHISATDGQNFINNPIFHIYVCVYIYIYI